MKWNIFFSLALVLVLVVGCSPSEAAPVEALTFTQTKTIISTNTATPAPTETTAPTSTPKPTETPIPTPTPLPAGSEVLNPENISQIELLDWNTFGTIINWFDIGSEGEEDGFAIQTDTQLVGYSDQGIIRYQVLTPLCVSASFACLETENTYALDIFDLATGEISQRLDHLVNFPSSRLIQYEWDDSNIIKLLLNSDSSLLAVIYADNMISLWDMNTGAEYPLPRTFDNAVEIAFSADSKLFAVTANFWEGNLTVFDISDLSDIQLLLAQNNVGHLVNQPFSMDNQYLLTAEKFARNAKYAYFNLEKMEMVERAVMPEGALPGFSSDGKFIIFRDLFSEHGGGTELIDLGTGERIVDQAIVRSILQEEQAGELEALSQFLGNDPMSISALFNNPAPDYEFDRGPYFPSGGPFPSVKVFPHENTTAIWNLESYGIDGEWFLELQRWLNGETTMVTVDPNNLPPDFNSYDFLRKMAQSQDSIFYCWNGDLVQQAISVASEQVTIAQNCAEPYVVAYDPAHNLTAYTVDARNAEVVNTDTGEVEFLLNGYSNPLGELIFSGDGNTIALLAVRPDDYHLDELMLFSLDHENGQAIALPLDLSNRKFQEFILDVDLAEDGSIMAVGVGKLLPALSEIHIWDFAGVGAKKRIIYTEWPNFVDLSPDKSLITAVSSSGIKIYSVKTSELLAEIHNPTKESIRGIMFSAEGKSLFVVIGSAVSVWGVP